MKDPRVRGGIASESMMVGRRGPHMIYALSIPRRTIGQGGRTRGRKNFGSLNQSKVGRRMAARKRGTDTCHVPCAASSQRRRSRLQVQVHNVHMSCLRNDLGCSFVFVPYAIGYISCASLPFACSSSSFHSIPVIVQKLR